MDSASSDNVDESETDSSVDKPRRAKLVCPREGCNASFSKPNKLTYHIRKHNGERPFVCPEEGCDKSYTNSTHLLRHKRVSHSKGKPQERFPCTHDGCLKEFANKYSLKVHIGRFHKDREYPFKCTHCNQGFFRKGQLQKHMYIHTGVLPFECDICNKRFSTNLDCSRHKSHHNVYDCECGETFNFWTLLLAHRKICTINNSKKEFPCDTCGKIFSSSAIMNRHKKVHLDKKERDIYPCVFEGCKRYYFYKNNLQYHITTFHENKKKKIPCPIEGCKVTLSKMQNVHKHVYNHKNKKPKKTNRNRRKDAGSIKHSTALKLAGIKLPYSANMHLLRGEQLNIKNTKRKNTTQADDDDEADSESDDEYDELMKEINEGAENQSSDDDNNMDTDNELESDESDDNVIEVICNIKETNPDILVAQQS
ncbi:PREDICTED: transcription factor IIIA-like [Nicrophorus vespilloides]|uniref:Transcription factor IIIA-like n=1 Tax=Nicrophorus vespilloides TaxID=110193 RepID=A0ABM1MF68_NICVS|nr:PREDICTED: transcription factor IIIA-like [Nicrophorus vespilloides]